MESKGKKIISRFTGHETTPSHFLVEIAMMRKAIKDKKTLPQNFWNSPLYKNEYKLQIVKASNLLKYFSLEDIIRGLESKDGSWIYSLSYKGLIDIIKKHQSLNKIEVRQVEKSNAVILDINPDNANIAPKSAPPRKSTINKLRSLDE